MEKGKEIKTQDSSRKSKILLKGVPGREKSEWRGRHHQKQYSKILPTTERHKFPERKFPPIDKNPLQGSIFHRKSENTEKGEDPQFSGKGKKRTHKKTLDFSVASVEMRGQ